MLFAALAALQAVADQTQVDPAIDLLNKAAQNGDVIAFIVGAVLVIVPFVLKALRKQVPVLDQILAVLPKAFNAIRGVKAPAAKPEAQQPGVAAVVKIVEQAPEEKK